MMAIEKTPSDPRAAHIELVQRDGLEPGRQLANERDDLIAAGVNPGVLEVPLASAVQPWHCRLIAGNAEKTWWTESYTERAGARDAVVWLGRLFSPVNRATFYCPANGSDGYLHVWLDDQEFGEKIAIPVRYVDERTTS